MNVIKMIGTIFILMMIFSNTINAQYTMQQEAKKVNVWDTYVTRKDGKTMHFDIIAPVAIKDANIIHKYGQAYLKTKGQEGQDLSAKQCRLCHIEILQPAWEKQIDEKGYFIIEMEGCE
ncbi:MAG: DUF2024 family protein [Aureispira sp.]